jgi:hypothetical protein
MLLISICCRSLSCMIFFKDLRKWR